MPSRVSTSSVRKSIALGSPRRKTARQRVKALEKVLNEQGNEMRRLQRRLDKAKGDLEEEVNTGRGRRFSDLIIGETFKAMYDKGTDGLYPRTDRLETIRAHQEWFLDFGLESPEHVDMLAEEVSFPLVQACVKGSAKLIHKFVAECSGWPQHGRPHPEGGRCHCSR